MAFSRSGSTNKYNAKRVQYDNHSFGSKLEASVYQILKLREKAGEIADIRCQVSVRLTLAGIRYIPDFAFTDVQSGEVVYAESKGIVGERFSVILNLWRIYGLGSLEIWKGTCTNPKLVETVIPTGECTLCCGKTKTG